MAAYIGKNEVSLDAAVARASGRRQTQRGAVDRDLEIVAAQRAERADHLADHPCHLSHGASPPDRIAASLASGALVGNQALGWSYLM
jgi:hypothetical protein